MGLKFDTVLYEQVPMKGGGRVKPNLMTIDVEDWFHILGTSQGAAISKRGGPPGTHLRADRIQRGPACRMVAFVFIMAPHASGVFTSNANSSQVVARIRSGSGATNGATPNSILAASGIGSLSLESRCNTPHP